MGNTICLVEEGLACFEKLRERRPQLFDDGYYRIGMQQLRWYLLLNEQKQKKKKNKKLCFLK